MKGDFIQLSNGAFCRKENIQFISRVLEGDFDMPFGSYSAKVVVNTRTPEAYECLYFKSAEEAKAEVDRIVRELTGWDAPKTRAYNSLGMAPCKFCGMAGDEELTIERIGTGLGLDGCPAPKVMHRGVCSSGHQGPLTALKNDAVKLWNEQQGVYA